MKNLGKITSIKEIFGLNAQNYSGLNGKNGSRLGLAQMINVLGNYSKKDGFEINTEKHQWLILIDNSQSCCESWGYITSDDDLEKYVGKTLTDVRLTDTALNTEYVEKSGVYGDLDGGGIQFVDFIFDDNLVLQFAVYNSHNGYYGHDILIVKDEKIILNDVI